ncbi:hypothetical protein JG688_00015446, partial [Phytophthora aleatoria]
TISEFTVEGAQTGFGSHGPVRSSTIKTTLFGIRHFLVAAGLDIPMDHPRDRMLMMGVGQRDRPRHPEIARDHRDLGEVRRSARPS